MKKGVWLLCLIGLLVCLLAAGCGEELPDASSDPSVDSPASGTVSEPSAAGKPAVSEEEGTSPEESVPSDESSAVDESSVVEESAPPDESSTANESNTGNTSSSVGTSESADVSDPEADPPPLSDDVRRVYSGLCFRLPVGWGTDPSSAPETLFFASSAEGSASVSASFTSLETAQGLTEALLIEEFRADLPAAWEAAGAKGVKAASVSVSLLGESHDALSLTASMNGKAVCQLQLYLFRGKNLYTLTVTAGSLADAKALLTAFEAE